MTTQDDAQVETQVAESYETQVRAPEDAYFGERYEDVLAPADRPYAEPVEALGSAPPDTPRRTVFVPLVNDHVDPDDMRPKVEVYRLLPSRDAKGRSIKREVPFLRAPLDCTESQLLDHPEVGPGLYRARLRRVEGMFGPYLDHDWRPAVEPEPVDEGFMGFEFIKKQSRASHREPPDSPPAAMAAPAPAADLLRVLADARAEREAALTGQSAVYEAQIKALRESTEAQLAAVKTAADTDKQALQADVRRLGGEAQRLSGELAKAEKALFEERMERKLAEARLELRPATASAGPAAQQSMVEMLGTYRRQKAEFEAIQAELGGATGASETSEPTEIDAATMMPRVMQHFHLSTNTETRGYSVNTSRSCRG